MTVFNAKNQVWIANPGNTLDGIFFQREADGSIKLEICADKRATLELSRRKIRMLIKALQELDESKGGKK